MPVDQEVFEAIIAEIRSGEATHRACSNNSLNRRDFYAHIAADEQAANRYARAKEASLEAMADDIIAIADDGSGDEDIRVNSNGEEYVAMNAEFAARSRLRVDSRKWLLSKLAPKKYGDKMELGSDPDKPLIHKIVREIVRTPHTDG